MRIDLRPLGCDQPSERVLVAAAGRVGKSSGGGIEPVGPAVTPSEATGAYPAGFETCDAFAAAGQLHLRKTRLRGGPRTTHGTASSDLACPVTSTEAFSWLDGGYFLVSTFETVFGDEPAQRGVNY